MSTEKNKAFVKEFVEAGNRGDVEGNIKYTTPDCLLNGEPFGREGDRQRNLMMLAAFPDGQYSMDDMIAEGDKVVLRWTFRGTHKGELMGIPATGKQVTMSGISIYHFANGMLAEIWENYDRFGFLQQLGVIPALG